MTLKAQRDRIDSNGGAQRCLQSGRPLGALRAFRAAPGSS